MTKRSISRARIGATASWTVLGLLLACGSEAMAQSAPDPDTQTVPAEADTPGGVTQDYDDVVVVGSRASQQSANARKKNARTATDSIVADDIGSFPDRNVAEAISRIPGAALNRNEFGEGDSVSIRGNGPDLTRVELDGVGMTSTTGLALNADSARSADLRELPADLVKSIDVVKGSTAEMTEGSLGGSIQIKTRSGLDFAKPYFSLRAGANRNSLGKEWQPDFNGVASRKFFNDRLGAIVSGSYSKIQNNGHGYEQTTSNNRNYARDFDFDKSPEKTFVYNLETLGTDQADVAFGNGSTETPRSVLTKSIAAQAKADCFTAFPQPGQTASNATKLQKLNELNSCLAQWNDATPSLIRHFMNEQTDERYAIDARLDYQLTDNLTVFVKGTYSGRNVHDQNRSRNPVSLLSANVAGSFQDTTTGYPRVRSVSPTAPAGYYLYDANSLVRIGNTDFLTSGATLNVDPSSVEVDENHNVTSMKLTNNSLSIDQIENRIETRTKFAQGGFEYNGDRLDIEGFAGFTEAKSTRGDMRTARNTLYGDATLTVQENGLWDIEMPSGFDDRDINNYVQLRAVPCISGTNPATCIAQRAVGATINNPATPDYTSNQLPLVTPGFSVSYSPTLGESSERIGKLDLSYKTEGLIPFITRIKVGGQYRNVKLDRWGGGGYTVKDAIGTFGQAGYVAPIVVPTANVRGTLRACQPSATSTVSCNYGFVPSTNLSNIRSGVDTLTPDELRSLFERTTEPAGSVYFGGLPNRGDLPDAWNGIRTDELFAELGASQFMNFDCLKTCVGSDGQVYAQPVTRTRETIKNVYAMADFEQHLPLGLLFNGNVGVRGVFTKVEGQGVLQLTSIRTTAGFNPNDPNNAAGISSTTFRQNVDLKGNTTDWLPSVNLNLWGFNEKMALRLYAGKTVARPNIGRLIPAGNCTIDQRETLDGDAEDIYGCGGRIGNPGLKPFTAWSYNASLEWYPNRDTVLSATFGKLDVQIGSPITATLNYRPFEGSSAIDPITNQPLSELEFSVPTYVNGPGYKRNIWEFQAKTAFTFLPWFLKYTGADVNYSKLSSAVTNGTRDPLSGDLMAPPGEAKYYMNASLWYDDGKLNLRVAYQKRSQIFNCITPCSGGNNVSFNYPGEGWDNVRLPYNPGVPRFTEGSTYIDAKISYNINRNFQIYAEGRNLTREATQVTTGGYEDFADGAPKVMRISYGGRRIMGGVRVQFGGTR